MEITALIIHGVTVTLEADDTGRPVLLATGPQEAITTELRSLLNTVAADHNTWAEIRAR